ncbi:hypothetical protein ACIQ8D_34190 [Streptomyces sp. NPDC096094]|uniref:hypothetical protein n=1 Tax=Streptomyces sp. NPDC096094 TaxID=3366073 RepID=UPI00381B3CED
MKLISAAKRATDKDWLAAKPRLAKASRTVTAVYRLWSEQLSLVTAHGADLDPAAMWRALETEIGPRGSPLVNGTPSGGGLRGKHSVQPTAVGSGCLA